MSNLLLDVQNYGQSLWYDNISRGLITTGGLHALVTNDGVAGVTSNPAIFQKALGSGDYEPAMRALIRQGVTTAKAIFERLAIEDIQLAADVLRPVYANTHGRDGYVSLEVSPYLADETRATIEEALRLRAAVGRDNLMIKVPATEAGLPAIEELIFEGVSVNVTLLFAVKTYESVAEAWMRGLERRVEAGRALEPIASVASFFVSRIDSLVDSLLSDDGLKGQAAVANAVLAYESYRRLTASDRWKALAERGARTQRLLWASTSTKDPSFPKTLYVDELIGPDTVNTLPGETLEAFRTEGKPQDALTAAWDETLAKARTRLERLAAAGISMDDVTTKLLEEGVTKFADAFDKLLGAVELKRQQELAGRLASQTFTEGVTTPVSQRLDSWRAEGRVRRLWAGDTRLWSGKDEDRWLGWLNIVDRQLALAEDFEEVAQDTRSGHFEHAVLLGMGGSSLCPDVLSRTFGSREGFPKLLVLDSTVPAQVLSFERQIDPARTLFIVASKSGSTTEPNILMQYFLAKTKLAVGDDDAGAHFMAITDPGSRLEQFAQTEGFRRVVHGLPDIGGRFSALSHFGMMPLAVMGQDVPGLLASVRLMVSACDASVPPAANPGVSLGILLGCLALGGRDKLTIITSPAVASLGGWLEQLIAESTGKLGRGIIPIDGERPGSPAVYGHDRLFVYVRVDSEPLPEQDAAVAALEKAGQPVVTIGLDEPLELGQEFFRWELATAVAGSLLGINPFDQPDVEASKVATRKLAEAYEQTGRLPEETALLEADGLRLFADDANAAALGEPSSVAALLKAHLDRLEPGDYFAVNAYLEMSEANRSALQELRHAVRDTKRVATTLGFGPRFLHSTGQLHKGGPASGVFLQLTSDDHEDVPVPGQKLSFGLVKRFQAQGDFEVLASRKRRLIRVHLGADAGAGLERLKALVSEALG